MGDIALNPSLRKSKRELSQHLLRYKAREQHRNLYIAFVDFTKAFDSVNRNALWVIMKKMGCPPKFVAILKCLHRDMTVRILVDNELTSEIAYNNGVKQGCILAPTLFAIFAAAMFMHAFSDSPSGVSIRFPRMGRFSTWLVSDHNPNV